MVAFDKFKSQLGINTSRRKGVGYDYAPFTVAAGQLTPGQKVAEKVGERKTIGNEIFEKMRGEQTNRMATDLAGKSAFDIPTDEFGLVDRKLTKFDDIFKNQLDSATKRGNLAYQTEFAKSEWQRLKQIQDLQAYGFSGNISVNGASIPGATGNNPGAKAVALAMKAYNNRTPYVWGGNSLTRGVDCSGLVQQVYRQLGINVPRTTWQQAKHGRKVSLKSMQPGDLIFYRGLGHVGIYMGNGKFVHAANSRSGMLISNVYGSSNGAPQMAIRPY